MSNQILLENSDVRVTRWTLSGGEETGQHRHVHNYVVVPLAAGRMRVTAADGDISFHPLQKGVPYYREAGAEHTVRSDNDGVLDFIEVELLRPAT
jgi:quercetin dioxygenase-like cupin family protein